MRKRKEVCEYVRVEPEVINGFLQIGEDWDHYTEDDGHIEYWERPVYTMQSAFEECIGWSHFPKAPRTKKYEGVHDLKMCMESRAFLGFMKEWYTAERFQNLIFSNDHLLNPVKKTHA